MNLAYNNIGSETLRAITKTLCSHAHVLHSLSLRGIGMSAGDLILISQLFADRNNIKVLDLSENSFARIDLVTMDLIQLKPLLLNI